MIWNLHSIMFIIFAFSSEELGVMDVGKCTHRSSRWSMTSRHEKLYRNMKNWLRFFRYQFSFTNKLQDLFLSLVRNLIKGEFDEVCFIFLVGPHVSLLMNYQDWIGWQLNSCSYTAIIQTGRSMIIVSINTVMRKLCLFCWLQRNDTAPNEQGVEVFLLNNFCLI